jgi:hypothetical protein
MNNIKNVSEANFLDIYLQDAEEGVFTTIPITDIATNTGTGFLEFNEILLTTATESLYNLAEKCNHTLPSFVLIKILKRPYVDKIVFRNNEEVIDTLYFYEVNELGVRINDQCFSKWSILRFEYNRESVELEHDVEYYIHIDNYNAHLDNIKKVPFEIMEKSIVHEHHIDDYFNSNLADSVASTLITKEFQLFYMGNLMSDRDEWLLPDEYKSYRTDSISINDYVNIDYINRIEYSDYLVGE